MSSFYSIRKEYFERSSVIMCVLELNSGHQFMFFSFFLYLFFGTGSLCVNSACGLVYFIYILFSDFSVQTHLEYAIILFFVIVCYYRNVPSIYVFSSCSKIVKCSIFIVCSIFTAYYFHFTCDLYDCSIFAICRLFLFFPVEHESPKSLS